MKSMSLELIKGTVDEVDEVVHVNWVLPRYLSKEHLQIMVQKLGEWGTKMENVIILVENGAEELLHN